MQKNQNSPSPLLKMEKISKQFPGALALDQIDFDLKEGEVHVMFGENGAGKSTLINIIAGALKPTAGKVLYRGAETYFHSVQDARKLGVSAVFQEFSLVPQLTIAQNLFLGVEKSRYGFLDKAKMQQEATLILNRLKFDLNPSTKIVHLSRAEQQMVEIAKVFSTDLSILILDEPTASLTEKETEQLFALIEQAKTNQVGIIYITHRMKEIRRISNRVTILRDGKHIKTVQTDQVTDNDLVEWMTGRVIEQIFPTVHFHPTKTMLSVQNLTTANQTVMNASIEVKQGEIVGMAGLVGSGKSEIMRACFGIEKIKSGKLFFDNQEIQKITPAQMLELGMFYIPPDRRNEGLLMMRNVRENVALASLSLPQFSFFSTILKRKKEKEMVLALSQKLNLQPLRVEQAAAHFSGGNQQKILLAKVLTRKTKLLIFDEPTVGVDVGTRSAIYQFIFELCQAGAAIVLISSDLPEILHLTHRAYVFYRGNLRAELQGKEITEKNVLHHFFEKDVA